MDSHDGRRRRRGSELDAAILSAAWEVLRERGYAGFTIDAVAKAAKTSRSVVYRRWATTEELTLAAIRWRSVETRIDVPMTGSLRGDAMEVLHGANATRQEMFALLARQLGEFYDRTGMSPDAVRQSMLAGREPVMRTVVDNAKKRGELGERPVPEHIVALPFDLFRSEAIMTLSPVPEEHLRRIVDDIFLPLIEPYRAGGPR